MKMSRKRDLMSKRLAFWKGLSKDDPELMKILAQRPPQYLRDAVRKGCEYFKPYPMSPVQLLYILADVHFGNVAADHALPNDLHQLWVIKNRGGQLAWSNLDLHILEVLKNGVPKNNRRIAHHIKNRFPKEYQVLSEKVLGEYVGRRRAKMKRKTAAT
jgi:hypothetical protein